MQGFTVSDRLSSAGPEILGFVSSANFQPILDCFIPNFESKYGDSENIKADRVNMAIFNLITSNQTLSVFWDTRYIYKKTVYGINVTFATKS